MHYNNFLKKIHFIYLYNLSITHFNIYIVKSLKFNDVTLITNNMITCDSLVLLYVISIKKIKKIFKNMFFIKKLFHAQNEYGQWNV